VTRAGFRDPGAFFFPPGATSFFWPPWPSSVIGAAYGDLTPGLAARFSADSPREKPRETPVAFGPKHDRVGAQGKFSSERLKGAARKRFSSWLETRFEEKHLRKRPPQEIRKSNGEIPPPTLKEFGLVFCWWKGPVTARPIVEVKLTGIFSQNNANQTPSGQAPSVLGP